MPARHDSMSDQQQFAADLANALRHAVAAPLLRESLLGTAPGEAQPRTTQEAGLRMLDRMKQSTDAQDRIYADLNNLSAYEFSNDRLETFKRAACDFLVAMYNAIGADNKRFIYLLKEANPNPAIIQTLSHASFDAWNAAHETHNVAITSLHQLRQADLELASSFGIDDYLTRQMLRRFSAGRAAASA